MNRYRYLFLYLFLVFIVGCTPAKNQTPLKILQFNIWQEGTVVEGGFEGIVDNILNVDPDLITFSEVRNYNETEFIPRLLQSLADKGATYYGLPSTSTGILSKYPIKEQEYAYPIGHGSILKATIPFYDKTIILYSAHLDYTRYACYLPRGYSGTTWEKIKEPIVDVDSIITVNRESFRDEAIKELIDDARKEREKGHFVFVGGDFNEPSYLDWTEETKNMFDHNGTVVPWDCSVILYENGFKDAYREFYPNPVTHPGFTFPSDNPDMQVNKLTWAPEADERDRIDFIYYVPDASLKLQDAVMVGPSSSIIRNVRTEETSQDKFILPVSPWPTDHKAVMATFMIK